MMYSNASGQGSWCALRSGRFRRDQAAVEGPIEDLAGLMVVVLVIVLFIVSLTTIYRIRDDQDRKADLQDLCMSFSRTVLSHPLLLEEPYLEEGLFSASKLLALKESYGDGTEGEDDPLDTLVGSVNSDQRFGWELDILDVSPYSTSDDLSFSVRSTPEYGPEIQSLVWSVSIFVDVGEVHPARLMVMVWEVP